MSLKCVYHVVLLVAVALTQLTVQHALQTVPIFILLLISASHSAHLDISLILPRQLVILATANVLLAAYLHPIASLVHQTIILSVFQ